MYPKLKEHFQKFVEITEADYRFIFNKIKSVHLKKNEIWKSEGRISQQFAFLNTGLMRHFYTDNGNEKTEKFYLEKSWVGDLASFLSQTPSLRNFVAIEKSELLVINFNELENFYNKSPSLERFGRKYAEQLLIDQQNRSRSFLLDSAKTKYINLMNGFPELIQRVPQYLIAQYLGIKPETLSRIRRDLLT